MPFPTSRHDRRGRLVAARAIAAAAVVVVATMVALTARPAAAAPTVEGSGSTFAEVAIGQWRADVARSMGLSINYSGNGSTAGRGQFANGIRDFASSDVSYRFSDPTENLPDRPFTYLPLVAGGTAVMYRLFDGAGRRITDLRLTPGTLARVVTWDIKFWDDAAVLADNPHLAGRLRHTPVRPIVRADGSGTTAVFTNYLLSTAPGVWNNFITQARRGASNESYCQVNRACDKWPANLSGFGYGQGSDSIAGTIASTTPTSEGTVGYAEAAYAIQKDVPTARVQNGAGQFTLPTARAVAIALTQAGRNADGTYDLSRVFGFSHPEAYTISSYNYLVVSSTGSGFDPAKGDVLGRWMLYSITDGQKKAADLGYSPLPTNLIQQGFDVLKTLPGAPTPPDDPSVWGRFYESLRVEEAIENPTTTTTAVTTAAGGTGGAGAGTGGAGAGAAGAGTAGAGAGAGGGSAGGAGAPAAPASGAAAGGAAAKAGAKAGARGATTPGAAPGSEIAGAPPVPGDVAAAAGGGGTEKVVVQLDPGRVKRAAERLASADARRESAAVFVVVGLVLVALVFGPPLAPLAAAPLRRRRSTLS